jgi:hypothetical protein
MASETRAAEGTAGARACHSGVRASGTEGGIVVTGVVVAWLGRSGIPRRRSQLGRLRGARQPRTIDHQFGPFLVGSEA